VNIDQAFDEFIEFPEGSSGNLVTTVSAKLFAKYCVEQMQEENDRLQAQLKKLNAAATAVIDSRAAMGLDVSRYSVDMGLLIELSHLRPAMQTKEQNDAS
jgi:hypothetical protein